MIVVTYESTSADTPAYRRFLSQVEKVKGGFYVTFHGASAEESRAKADTFLAKMPRPKAAPHTDEPLDLMLDDDLPDLEEELDLLA
jgi:hypothetical protein